METRVPPEPRPLTPTQHELVALGREYLCAHPSDLEVTHSLARVCFETQHWEEAVLLFELVAFGDATADLPPIAAMLYLESLGVLRSHFARTECYDEMEANVPRLRAHLCTPPVARSREKTCTTLEKIDDDIHKLRSSTSSER